MRDVHPHGRLPLLGLVTLLCAAVLMFTGCSCAIAHGGRHLGGVSGTLSQGQGSAACANGAKAANYAPVICVDDSGVGLRVSPDEIHVVKHNSKKQPTVVNWFTTSGASILRLQANAGSRLDACFAYLSCSEGHCVAVMDVNAAAGTRCEYTAMLAGGQLKPGDPIIIVDDCCPPPSGMP